MGPAIYIPFAHKSYFVDGARTIVCKIGAKGKSFLYPLPCTDNYVLRSQPCKTGLITGGSFASVSTQTCNGSTVEKEVSK